MSPRAGCGSPRIERVLQAILRALWVGAIPALLAGLVLKFLVPPPAAGLPGLVATIGRRYPVPLGVALFFLFSIVARYWRFHLPGGRYASTVSARVAPEERDSARLRRWEVVVALHAAFAARSSRKRVSFTLGAAGLSDFDRRFAELELGLETSDLERASRAAKQLESLDAAGLARRQRHEALATAGAVTLAAAAVLGVRATLFESYQVLSSSMLPTLEIDDRIFGRKRSFPASAGRTPNRGDVVVFRSASVADGQAKLPEVLVKRVVGIPGDRIAMHGGVPVINGWEVPTCSAGAYLYVFPDGQGGALQGLVFVEFLEDRAYLTVHTTPMPEFPGSYVVPPGEVFVLGDNRGNSVDSRTYRQRQGGGVPLDAIEAQVQRFLVGTHRRGDADLSRFLEPIDGLERELHVEGVNAGELRDGIARCLAHRPTDPHPPPPPELRVGGASQPTTT